MPWPLSQDYNEAIQSPRTSFADPELRDGEAAVNALGLPMPCSGNFADVYRFDCPATGRTWAVKCFTRKIPGLRERYHRIGLHLGQVKLPFMVDFTLLDQGIRIRGEWFPALKMQWVEGVPLNQFVKICLDKPQVLDILGQIWVKQAGRLREAAVGHGDLQHGNVLLVPGGKADSLSVKLVDYDGMCVPALSLLIKSGEVGHPAYQHPQRLREGIYNLEVDRFSHLVIYTALRGLMAGGRPLWERYDNGDNLLFCQQDFREPGSSSLFRELTRLHDPEVRRLAEVLSRAAQGPMERTPLLAELVASQRPPPLPVWGNPEKEGPAAVAKAGEIIGGRPVRSVPDSMAPTPVRPRALSARGQRKQNRQRRWLIWTGAALLGLTALLTGTAVLSPFFFPFERGEPGNQVDAVSRVPEQKEKPRVTPPPKEEFERFPKLPVIETKQPTEAVKKMEAPLDPAPTAKAGKKARLQPGEVVTAELRPGVEMKLAWIPPGEFLMGGDKDVNEKPIHRVTLTKGFYMGVFPVTQAQWQAVMDTNPSHFRGDDRPVEKVSWDDCQKFCEKLKQLTGKAMRLPTEAEWEYACRAGSTSEYYNGDGEEALRQVGWSSVNSGGQTHPVGQLAPNAWGLYDMHGNVQQWCQDLNGAYVKGNETDPKGSYSGNGRVIRGGSWLHFPADCRAAIRLWYSPTYFERHIGCRVCFSSADTVPLRKDERVKPPQIHILAVIDGADTLRISEKEGLWLHHSWQWPSGVKVNGLDWNPKDNPRFANAGTSQLLGKKVDFTTAKLSVKRARGRVELKTASDHIDIYFDDNGPLGADTYEVIIILGK